jgi:hypothetical protein
MLPMAEARGFSWWSRRPVLHERRAGHPPDYLATARILERLTPCTCVPCPVRESRGDAPAAQGVHLQSKQRPRFYALAFPGQPPTYDSVKVPSPDTTNGMGRSNSVRLVGGRAFTGSGLQPHGLSDGASVAQRTPGRALLSDFPLWPDIVVLQTRELRGLRCVEPQERRLQGQGLCGHALHYATTLLVLQRRAKAAGRG